MNTSTRFIFTFAFLVFASFAFSQERIYQKIKLIDWDSVGSRANFAVWRTDFYICTGIAYAKTLGKTTDDFAHFVGHTHSWDEIKGKGLAPAVQTLYGLIKLYENGKFEIVSESDTLVTMRSNRPYMPYFKDGPMLGVSIEEFERCLWGHIAILADRVGLLFKYKIEADQITLSLTMRQ
jgi:hypothetical protein